MVTMYSVSVLMDTIFSAALGCSSMCQVWMHQSVESDGKTLSEACNLAHLEARWMMVWV